MINFGNNYGTSDLCVMEPVRGMCHGALERDTGLVMGRQRKLVMGVHGRTIWHGATWRFVWWGLSEVLDKYYLSWDIRDELVIGMRWNLCHGA